MLSPENVLHKTSAKDLIRLVANAERVNTVIVQPRPDLNLATIPGTGWHPSLLNGQIWFRATAIMWKSANMVAEAVPAVMPRHWLGREPC